MTSKFELGLISESEEAEKLGKIISQCFNEHPNTWPLYRDRLGLENFRVLRKQGQIVGGFGIYQMGQWWGDRCVPMAGVAAVGVPPEHRGTGVALELMSQSLKEFQANGVAIATLYPATQQLYRKVGYEQGGTRCIWELPIESITLKGDRTLPMQPVQPLHHKIFHDIYRQHAIKNNGNLDRNPAIWQGIIQHSENVIYAYLVGSETQPEGYVIFSPKSEGKDSYLEVWDWVALTPLAMRRLWTFCADSRSQINKVTWRGSAVERLLLLLPEQTAIARNLKWMLRVVDVSKALEARGYPPGIEAELHLAVRDNLLPENNSNFVLKVAGGGGEVVRGGRGDLQLDVGGLAPLYTGLFTPHQLQQNGQLEATETALSVAAQMFAGSHPWMPDFF